jgi:FMN-dependent NADH-azoreductase
MKTLLQLNTSLFRRSRPIDAAAPSVRRKAALERTRARRSVSAIIGREPVPHLTAEALRAFLATPESRTAEQRRSVLLRRSDRRIASRRRHRHRVADVQLRRALVAEGLYRSRRAGREYVPVHRAGPCRPADRQEGLLFATRGGAYAGTPLDTQTTYVRDFLRFIGIDDVEFVYASA